MRELFTSIRRSIRGRSQSWSVHSTVNEPLELVCAFVAHYLAMGAAEVHLCLDRHREDLIDVLGRVNGVRLTVCDDAYWAKAGHSQRPIGISHRQIINLQRAYENSRYGWLLFCDADEFLHLDPRLGNMKNVLALFGEDIRYHIFSPAERFYPEGGPPPLSVFDGSFRRRNAKVLASGPTIYGKDWPYFSRALLQDGPGKSLLKIRAGLIMDIHAPRDRTNGEIRVGGEERAALEQCHFLHFDGLTPLHWALKLAQWYDSMMKLDNGDRAKIATRRTPARHLQAVALYDQRQDAEALRAMTRLQVLTDTQMAGLTAVGGLVDVRHQIEATARALFPGVVLDFSQAEFDRRLRLLHADFIKTSGFAL